MTGEEFRFLSLIMNMTGLPLLLLVLTGIVRIYTLVKEQNGRIGKLESGVVSHDKLDDERFHGITQSLDQLWKENKDVREKISKL